MPSDVLRVKDLLAPDIVSSNSCQPARECLDSRQQHRQGVLGRQAARSLVGLMLGLVLTADLVLTIASPRLCSCLFGLVLWPCPLTLAFSLGLWP